MPLQKLTRVCDCLTAFAIFMYIFMEEIVNKILPLLALIFTIIYGLTSYFNWKAPKEEKVPHSVQVLGHPYTGFAFFLIIDFYLILQFCLTGSF